VKVSMLPISGCNEGADGSAGRVSKHSPYESFEFTISFHFGVDADPRMLLPTL
jgi:hypothetical protein